MQDLKEIEVTVKINLTNLVFDMTQLRVRTDSCRPL